MNPLLLILCTSFTLVQADLTCLEWSLISPVAGLFCFFEPQLETAANKTVAAVQQAIDSAEDLVQFDLTHNPAVVTYDFIEQTQQGGLAQGEQYMRNVSTDVRDVTIGFGKETSNQILQIYELTYWDDVSFCLITGAAHLVTQAKQKRSKRAILPSVDAATSMARGCVSDKLKELASPAVFHVNGSNEKIGSTIADLAAFLIPVGAAEQLTSKTAKGAVDLAIPGSEDTTRIFKMVGDKQADHFASDVEAEGVAESMKDPKWVDENCGICNTAVTPLDGNTSKRRRGRVYRLRPRGELVSTCCRRSSMAPSFEQWLVEEETPSTSTDYESAEEPEELLDPPLYDPEDYRHYAESDLVPPPVYKMRDVSSEAGLQGLQQDLDQLSTGFIPWDSTLTGVMSSEEVFSTLRNIFEGPKDADIYTMMSIDPRDGIFRLTSFSDHWIDDVYPPLKPLQDFVHAAVEQGINTVMKLKGPKERASELRGNIEFFYTPPSQKALTGTDPRGFHTDGGLMQFATADTPGLIICNAAEKTASRVAIQKNTFQLMKAKFWDMSAWLKNGPDGPTWHSVFGPEMAEKGRISMVMSIFVQSIAY